MIAGPSDALLQGPVNPILVQSGQVSKRLILLKIGLLTAIGF